MHYDAKILLYDIQKAGYYKRSRRGHSHVFAALNEILASMGQWLNRGLTIDETRTFEPSDNCLPVFCYSLHDEPNTGDYLLITWNQQETINGKFAAIHGNDAVGNPQIETQDVLPGTIPGFPSYFYILPEEKILSAVIFEGASTGTPGLQLFMQGFLEKLSRWVICDENDGDQIIGYSNDSDIQEGIYPSFKVKRKIHPGKIQYLKDHRNSIVRIQKREHFKRINNEHVGWGNSAWRLLTGNNNDPAPQFEDKFEFSIDYTPTENELNGIIAIWQNIERQTQWQDVGFKISGENNVRWLGKAMARTEQSMDINPKSDSNGVIIDEMDLLHELGAIRDRLITIFHQGQ